MGRTVKVGPQTLNVLLPPSTWKVQLVKFLISLSQTLNPQVSRDLYLQPLKPGP